MGCDVLAPRPNDPKKRIFRWRVAAASDGRGGSSSCDESTSWVRTMTARSLYVLSDRSANSALAFVFDLSGEPSSALSDDRRSCGRQIHRDRPRAYRPSGTRSAPRTQLARRGPAQTRATTFLPPAFL